MNRALELLLEHLPEPMRQELRNQSDEDFAEEVALDYCRANDLEKADMLAFFTSGGPDMVAKVKERRA